MKISLGTLLRTSQSAGFLLLCATAPVARAGSPPVDSKEAVPPAPEPAQPWRFRLELPGWLAATSGTVGVDGINSHVYLGADTLLKHLDMTASLGAEVRKGRFGIYGDLLYVSASDGIGTDGLVKKVDVRLDQYLADMELNFRLLEGPRGWLDVRAGVRYTNIYNKLTLQANDEVIDDTSERIVDNVSQRIATAVKSQLSELDLKERVKSAVTEAVKGRLAGVEARTPTLPVAPLNGRKPAILREEITRLIDRINPALTTAIRAAAVAEIAETRAVADAAVANAQAQIDADKKALANRVAAKAQSVRAAAQEKVDNLKKKVQKEIARKLSSELNTTASLSKYWFDPYVGLSARYNLSKAFYLVAKGDIGGFGVGSELTWQASGALGCQVTRYIHTEIGYRYLYTDYNHDGFVYNVSQSGVQITTGISF